MVSGSDRGDEKAKKRADANDPFGAIHDVAGQALNSALGTVTGFDAKALVAKLPPENIASYMRGKDIDPQSPGLSAQEKADLKIYTALHDSLTANIPFYDHSAFVKSMEEEISERSKQSGNGEHRKAEGDNTSNASTETVTTKTKEADKNLSPALDGNADASTKTLQPKRPGTQDASTDERMEAVKVDTKGGGSGSSRKAPVDGFLDAGKSVKSDLTGNPAASFKSDSGHDLANSSKVGNSSAPGNSFKLSSHHDSAKSSNSDISQDLAQSSRSDMSHEPAKSSKPDISHNSGMSSQLDISQEPGRLSKSAINHDLGNSSKDRNIHDPANSSKIDVIHDSNKSSKLDASQVWDKSINLDFSRDLMKTPESDQDGAPENFTKSEISVEPRERTRSNSNGHPDKQDQPDYVSHPINVTRAEIDESGKVKNIGTVSSGTAVNPLSASIFKEQSLIQNKPNDADKSTENHATAPPQNLSSSSTDSSSGDRSAEANGAREIKSRSEDSREIPQGKSQRSEFGTKKSEPITWDNIVHSQKQSEAHASPNPTTLGENKPSSKELSAVKSSQSTNSSAPVIHQGEQSLTSKNDSRIAAAQGHTEGDKSIRTIANKENVERFNQLLNSQGIATIRWQNSLNQTPSEIAKTVSNRQMNTVFPPMMQSNIDGTKGDANHDLNPFSVSKANDNLIQVSATGNFTLSPKTAETASFTATAKTFNPSDKRYILGSEIALAVIIAAAGATRIRAEGKSTGLHPELIPGDEPTDIGGRTVDAEESAGELHIALREDVSNVQEASGENEHSVGTSVQQTFAERANTMHETAEKRESIVHESKLGDSVVDNTSVPPTVRSTQTSKTALIRPKTLVASTDTLVSIAEAFFYDRNVAWLIADLNQSIVKETWMDGKRIIEIKSRQQIELPLWTDIEIFYKNKPSHARPEDLITIVQQTAIDAELLNDSLRKLLDPNNS